jgi:hypothetical protein
MTSLRSTAPRPAGDPLVIDAAHYLGIAAIRRVKPEWELTLAGRAFPPRPENPQADWLPTVVVPALERVVEDRGEVRAFASIGTGAGIDILTGIELLGARVVGATDVFPDITAAAEWNIRHNLGAAHPVEIHVGTGDLLTPLAGRGLTFDLIYENLPNIPLAKTSSLEEKRNSASFVPQRAEKSPRFVRNNLLELHHIALLQARDFLSRDGFVLSTLGGRVPLECLRRLSESAGLAPGFLTYSWKAQAEGGDVLPSYAALERKGLGPFSYYPAEALKKVFEGISPRESGVRALEIEQDLRPWRISASQAWEAYRGGQRIGHTVAVLKSAKR